MSLQSQKMRSIRVRFRVLTTLYPRLWWTLIHRLEGAKDWAVSRNRFWGTPMPMWVSDDGEEMVAVGSIAELKELSGVEVTQFTAKYMALVVKTLVSNVWKP